MRRRGFTLLELLLALALVVIIAGAMATTLFAAFKAKARAEAAVGATRARDAAVDEMVRDLSAALAPTPVNPETAGTAALTLIGPFEGTTNTVSFYRAAVVALETPSGQVGGQTGGQTGAMTFGNSNFGTQPVVQSGVQMVEYSVENVPGQTDTALVRRTTANLLAPIQTTPDPEVIGRSVQNLTLRYFDGTSWYDQWDSTVQGTTQYNTVPVAVEISFQMAASEAGQPPFVVDRIVPVPCGVSAAATDTTTSGLGGGAF